MKRIYNLKRDEVDERDYKKLYRPHPSLTLPKSVDLREKMPPVYDQLDLGSCTANAGVAYRSYLLLPEDSTPPELSRLDLYWEERDIEGTVNEDSGATMRDVGKALKKSGVCEEKYYPYDVDDFTDTPSKKANENALKYKISAYSRLSDTDNIMIYLAVHQKPVLMGMDVYESFESDETSKTGMVTLPKDTEELLGGHAVLIVGYKYIKDDLYFIVRNSWGEQWGDKGYFYLPVEYIKKGYAYDFWVLSE